MQRPHEIDRFEDYRDTNAVQEQSPDPAQARHLRERSYSKVETMETLNLTTDTATDYFEILYEACRMLIQGAMAADGYKPYSHEAIVAYGIDELDIDMVNANSLNRYRKLRNDIVHRGEIATIEKAEAITALQAPQSQKNRKNN